MVNDTGTKAGGDDSKAAAGDKQADDTQTTDTAAAPATAKSWPEMVDEENDNDKPIPGPSQSIADRDRALEMEGGGTPQAEKDAEKATRKEARAADKDSGTAKK